MHVTTYLLMNKVFGRTDALVKFRQWNAKILKRDPDNWCVPMLLVMRNGALFQMCPQEVGHFRGCDALYPEVLKLNLKDPFAWAQQQAIECTLHMLLRKSEWCSLKTVDEQLNWLHQKGAAELAEHYADDASKLTWNERTQGLPSIGSVYQHISTCEVPPFTDEDPAQTGHHVAFDLREFEYTGEDDEPASRSVITDDSAILIIDLHF